MTKQGKAQQARRPPERFDDSALLRSAETLGRMIGALQRQLDGAARRFSRSAAAGLAAKAAAGPPLHRNNGHATTVVKPRRSRTAAAKSERAVKPKSGAARPVKAKTTKTAKRSSRRS